jgi:hypothetical protein
MEPLKDRLARLEVRLQTLVEGSLARLFTQGLQRQELARQLVEALYDSIEAGEDDSLQAPGAYLLQAHPALAQGYLADPATLDELAGLLRRAGAEAGIRFNGPLHFKVTPDAALALREIRVRAERQTAPLGDTQAMSLPASPPEAPPAAGAFLIVPGGQIFPLSQAVTNLGRRADNHLVLDDPRVSRSHAQVRLSQGRCLLFDLNSSGGTFVNEQRIQQRLLKPGDVISLAGVPLIFGQELPGELDATQEYRPAAQAGPPAPPEPGPQ